MTFGMDGEEPVSVPIGDGRAVRFRGSADRIDRAADGTLLVIDLKTGSTRRYKGLDADPVLGGTKLQLPVYAYAARQRYGEESTPVEAAYWFVRKDRGERIEVRLTPEVERRYADTLGVIADSIAAGIFPQRPPENAELGVRRVLRSAIRTAPATRMRGPAGNASGTHPVLVDYVRLAEPEALARAWTLEGMPKAPTRAWSPGVIDDRPAVGSAGRCRCADADHHRVGRDVVRRGGRGIGQDQSLVDRVVHTVLAGVAIENVAAVTFTEKAGAELRDRLRTEFEAVVRTSGTRPSSAVATDAVRRERAEEALDGLDSCGHRHAALLRPAHPDRAPDRGRAAAAGRGARRGRIERRVRGTLGRAVPGAARRRRARRAVAARARGRAQADPPAVAGEGFHRRLGPRRRPRGVRRRPRSARSCRTSAALVAEARELADMATCCSDPTDKFLPRLDALARWADRLAAAPDRAAQLTSLTQAAYLAWAHGRKANWRCNLDDLRARCKALAATASGHAEAVVDAVLRTMARRIGTMTVAAAEARRREGRLEFHDLLVLARDLLRHDSDVRAALSARYQRLLLDEFQDTDPIQIELAVRIAGGAAATADRWEDVVVPPGRLFVVGDPKQSIYRFRRADIATYLRTQEHLGSDVRLSTNFRTVGPVLDWVNAVFDELITFQPQSQPAYQPLDHHRGEPPAGAPVTVLGAVAHGDKLSADQLREREAADVAAVIRTAIAEGWQVWDDAAQDWRRVGLGDIAILVPARTSLPHLEDALDAAAIPYRAETSSLVYQARRCATCSPPSARSTTPPTRSPSSPRCARRCSAAATTTCGPGSRRGARSTCWRPLPGRRRTPIRWRAALDYLRRLHRRARWLTPSEVLGALVADRRVLETAADGPRARDAWRRLRFVVDQARAWSEAEHGGLRAYLAWAGHQGERRRGSPRRCCPRPTPTPCAS